MPDTNLRPYAALEMLYNVILPAHRCYSFRFWRMVQKKWTGPWRSPFNGQLGINLIEMVIALGILAAVGGAFMVSLRTAVDIQELSEEQVQAENIARSYLEHVRNQPFQDLCYPDCYTVSISTPPGFTVNLATKLFCTPEPCTGTSDDIQETTVSVLRGVERIFQLTDVRTRR